MSDKNKFIETLDFFVKNCQESGDYQDCRHCCEDLMKNCDHSENADLIKLRLQSPPDDVVHHKVGKDGTIKVPFPLPKSPDEDLVEEIYTAVIKRICTVELKRKIRKLLSRQPGKFCSCDKFKDALSSYILYPEYSCDFKKPTKKYWLDSPSHDNYKEIDFCPFCGLKIKVEK